MTTSQQAAEAAIYDQTNLLPRKQLLIVFAALSVSLLICFVDQNGVGVALPAIGEDLHAEATVSWAGTSALIANTVFQVLYGRLSDIFGEMNCTCWHDLGFILIAKLPFQVERLSFCPHWHFSVWQICYVAWP